MGGGYVLDFSNPSFQEFVYASTRLDIFEDKYLGERSGSKANRLREFWSKEGDFAVGSLIRDLVEYSKDAESRNVHWRREEAFDVELYEECLKIAERLLQSSPVANLDAIEPNANCLDFALLAKNIKESILKNEPMVALDRLHTFMVKYLRNLNDKYRLSFDKETPLHSLFGQYVKHLTSTGLVESEMSVKILKTSISVLDAFSEVRNEKSFAHDNPILNYRESMLIFNDICNLVKFIESLEGERAIISSDDGISAKSVSQ